MGEQARENCASGGLILPAGYQSQTDGYCRRLLAKPAWCSRAFRQSTTIGRIGPFALEANALLGAADERDKIRAVHGFGRSWKTISK